MSALPPKADIGTLLCAKSGQSAPQQTAPYSISSSAMLSKPEGTVSPSALAVFMLTLPEGVAAQRRADTGRLDFT
jgi:hypothetical protein